MNNAFSFLDDYSEGCHPRTLELMASSNTTQQAAYGKDEYSEQAKELIRVHLGNVKAPIFFISGGTLSNLIIIASSLRPHEAIIAAESGHIALHETGAIEATGHKVITVPSTNGKLTPTNIETTLANNSHAPHMAKPRMVYISNATELGTVYTKAELTSISNTCKANQLLLMIDGARLCAALASKHSDLTLQDIYELTDIFWIGGTKAGALIGEAVVIPNPQLAQDFEFHIKQRGALLAKGRVLGVQFLGLFEGSAFQDTLFYNLASSSNQHAEKLSTAITDCGYSLATPAHSNQVFPLLPNTLIEQLQKNFDFHLWETIDDQHSIIRLVTSWATSEDQVSAFLETLKKL